MENHVIKQMQEDINYKSKVVGRRLFTAQFFQLFCMFGMLENGQYRESQ